MFPLVCVSMYRGMRCCAGNGSAAVAEVAAHDDATSSSNDQPASSASESPSPVAVNLTPDLLSASWPVFTPDGQALVFLSSEAAARSGVHSATVAMYKLPWSDKVSCVI